MRAVLELVNVSAGYGARPVITDVSLTVGEGEIVVLLGANGAGKTTTLRAISGMIKSSGDIRLADLPLKSKRTDARAKLGLGHVPEGRGTFSQMTVRENLWAAASHVPPKKRNELYEKWFETFPRLRERASQVAGSLSGGEQQLLSVCRALMGEPKLVLLDEPSLGLAPLMIQEVFATLVKINREHDTAMLVVEQNAVAALSIAKRAYVLEAGSVVREGSAEELRNDDSVRRAYLGV